LAFQSWYTVWYYKSETLAKLQLTGSTAHAQVTGLLWFGVLGIAAVVILRGPIRAIGVAIATIGAATCQLSLFEPIKEGMPSSLSQELEKIIGLSLVQQQDLDMVVKSISTSPLSEAFLALGLLLIAALALVSAASLGWENSRKVDRYQLSKNKNTMDSDSSESQRIDPISLWDEQR
jgi:hypothetical protein